MAGVLVIVGLAGQLRDRRIGCAAIRALRTGRGARGNAAVVAAAFPAALVGPIETLVIGGADKGLGRILNLIPKCHR